MKTFEEWLKLQENKFKIYPSAYGSGNIERLAKERAASGQPLIKRATPHGNYVYCKSCGNQFVNKTNEDPEHFICKDCDNARRGEDD